MLKEGKYCEILDKEGDIIGVLKVYSDKSHNLKIIERDMVSGLLRVVELHSNSEVVNLYKFLKKHFEDDDEQELTHEQYLEFVEVLRKENCPEEEIDSEAEWRSEIEKCRGEE